MLKELLPFPPTSEKLLETIPWGVKWELFYEEIKPNTLYIHLQVFCMQKILFTLCINTLRFTMLG